MSLNSFAVNVFADSGSTMDETIDAMEDISGSDSAPLPIRPQDISPTATQYLGSVLDQWARGEAAHFAHRLKEKIDSDMA